MNFQLLPVASLHALGWSLVHFIWQGTLIALVYQCLVRSGCFKSASTRYIIGCLAMVAMCLAPIITYCQYQEHQTTAAMEVGHNAVANGIGATQNPSVNHPLEPAKPAISSSLEIAKASNPNHPSFDIRSFINPALPWIVAFWGLGVLCLSLRLLVGWMHLQTYYGQSKNLVLNEWQETLDRLAHQMSIQRPVRLVQSILTETPAVVGYLRPFILFPATALTGLNNHQIELLLAHELAHVRRHDYLVNLIQSLAEVLLFYHPAVWWLSCQVREEREHCCDDIAVKCCGSKLEYARTLMVMEQLRELAPALGVGAKSGSLLKRVRRLLDPQVPSRGQSAWWVLGVLFLMVGMAGINRSTAAQKAADKVPNPKISVGVNLPPAVAEKPGDSSAKSGMSKSPWFRQLKNGMSVELLGVSVDTDDKKKTWWTPNGKSTIEAPYDERKGTHSFGTPRVPRQFAFRVLGPEAHLDAEIVPATSLSTAAQSAIKNGKELNDLLLIFADFASNQKTCDIQLNIAGGAWAIRSFADKGGSAISGSDYGILVSDSLEVDGKTRVTVTYKKSQSQQIRLQVKDLNEKVHSPVQTLVSHGIGDMQQESLVFPLPLNQVRLYQIETRERQMVEFKEVALNPAHLLILSPAAPRLQFRLVAQENHNDEAEEYANSIMGGATLRVLKEVLLNEKHVRSAKIQKNPISQYPEVAFTLTDEGTTIFHDITQTNMQRQLAIIFDNRLISAPRIMSPIPGGKGIISGSFTETEVKAIVDCLNK